MQSVQMEASERFLFPPSQTMTYAALRKLEGSKLNTMGEKGRRFEGTEATVKRARSRTNPLLLGPEMDGSPCGLRGYSDGVVYHIQN